MFLKCVTINNYLSKLNADLNNKQICYISQNTNYESIFYFFKLLYNIQK